MTTMLDTRVAIVGAVRDALAADHPEWDVHWDNLGVPNQDDLEKFLCVELEYVNARQANLGPSPLHRRYGALKFYIAVKEGTGRNSQLALMDYLADKFQTRFLGPALMKAALPKAPVVQMGWVVQELWIPLEVDN